MFKLYSYFRSSASYRVRIALHWKGIRFEYVPIHLLKDGGQQKNPEYRLINPMATVPALEHDGFLLAESMAIIDYVDRIAPSRPLFPSDHRDRAHVLQICEAVNSGIQPLQNLKVTRALEEDFGLSKEDVNRWMNHWITTGMEGLERLLERTSGEHSFGDEVTAADCYVVPQCFAARRFGIKIEDYPTIFRVDAAATRLEGFAKAHPERQPDYQAPST